jgi:hypothetical protein
MYIKGTPSGYEDSVEKGESGWAVWKKRDDGKPPCAHAECRAPYNEKEPAHAWSVQNVVTPGATTSTASLAGEAVCALRVRTERC